MVLSINCPLKKFLYIIIYGIWYHRLGIDMGASDYPRDLGGTKKWIQLIGLYKSYTIRDSSATSWLELAFAFVHHKYTHASCFLWCRNTHEIHSYLCMQDACTSNKFNRKKHNTDYMFCFIFTRE